MDIPRESQAKKKRIKRIAYGAAAVVALTLLTVWVSSLEPALPSVDRETVYIGQVKRGEMLRQVRGPGTLVPEEITWISASTNGRVDRIVELPGTQVESSTVILRLSNPELEQQANAARLDLAAGEAELNDLIVTLDSQILNQRAEASRVRADYEESKLDAAAQKELAEEGLTPAIDYKRAVLREAQLSTRDRIEQERLEKLQSSVEAQIATQKVRLEQLEAVYRLRRDQVEQLTVRAGIRGVLQEVPLEVGQQVAAGDKLALVADPSLLKAELEIPQVPAQDLVLGQKALIDTRIGRDSVVEGIVKRIDPAVREGTVTVDVELTGELPAGVRPDLSVEGTIEIERLEDVLYVGRPSFGQADSRVELFKVLEDGRAVRVPVRLGRASVNTIEVKEGLEVGDSVILSDSGSWGDGVDAVRLR